MTFLWVLFIGILRILQATFNKKSSLSLSSPGAHLRFGLYFESAAAIFSLLYLFINGVSGFNAAAIICSAIMGVSFVLELATSLKSLQSAPLALCTMCSLGGGIVLPTVLGIFVFNEPMSIWQWIGIIFFFISAYLLMPVENNTLSLKGSAVIILICNFLINGLCGFISKYFAVTVVDGNPASFAFLSYLFASVLFTVILSVSCFKRKAMPQNDASSLPEKEPFLPNPVYFYGGAVGAVCASIVFLTTVLSRVVSIVILNTVPNAVCLIGSLLLEVTVFNGSFSLRNTSGIILNALATAVIVLF